MKRGPVEKKDSLEVNSGEGSVVLISEEPTIISNISSPNKENVAETSSLSTLTSELQEIPSLTLLPFGFAPLKPTSLNVSTAITDAGLQVAVKQGNFNKSFDLEFPSVVWQPFPDHLKVMLRDNLAYLSSIELGVIADLKKIAYNTPLPLFKPFFVELMLKCMLYSGDCDSGQTVEYISRLCNMQFSSVGESSLKANPWPVEEKSINTMTFGKESLLSLGLCWELGLDPTLVMMSEPDWDVIYRNTRIRTYENKHKDELIAQFAQEFNVHVHKVKNGFENLRFYGNWGLDETDLGWASQLTEYLFYLLPFSYAFKSRYIIFGNENSCDKTYFSKEGFKCNPVYDQSSEWMGHMNLISRTLTEGSVKTTSLVQPIHEIAVSKILYQRYPQLAKYQMSCHADNDGAAENRWCNSCSKCARCYTFMRALNFDPASVGLRDMFQAEYKQYFPLFNLSKEMKGFDSSGLSKDEQLFAFYLAMRNGAQGDLIELFKKEFLQEAIEREEELRKEFFRVHLQRGVPSPLWKRIKPIFEEELKK